MTAAVTTHDDRALLRGTLAGFCALGLFWGAWAAVLPSVQTATGATNGTLGVALFFIAVGSLPAMLFLAGPAVDRFGSRAVSLSCAVFAAVTLVPGFATSVPALAAALVLTGAASGILDVGINANAARIETRSGKRVMPLAHGLYSTGVLVGAVGAGLARGAGVGREPILVAVAALIGLTALLLRSDDDPPPLVSRPRRRVRLEHGLLVLGLVAGAAFVVEGGTESWSALFLERQLNAEPAVSGLGPGVFGAAMAAGRFFGQGTRRGDRTLLVGGSLLAAGGCTIVAVSPGAPLALLGFAVAGAGISLNAPVVFGVAGRGRIDAAGAIATVTTIGYLGLLIGPPFVGGIAQAGSLRISFLALAAIAAVVAVAASRISLQAHSRGERDVRADQPGRAAQEDRAR
jgi:MFS family permease